VAGEGSGMRPDQEREYIEYVTGRLSRLHRTAYMLCGDAHRADDIVQATLTALYPQWKRVTAADNVDAYVHSILVRRYLDERRLRWSRVRLGDVPAHAATVQSADHGVVERDALMTALRVLPKGQRAVVVLRYFDDLSVDWRRASSWAYRRCCCGPAVHRRTRPPRPLRPRRRAARGRRRPTRACPRCDAPPPACRSPPG
jgi:DNA-directed RNA polymerase specialized sigma24 family protein